MALPISWTNVDIDRPQICGIKPFQNTQYLVWPQWVNHSGKLPMFDYKIDW